MKFPYIQILPPEKREMLEKVLSKYPKKYEKAAMIEVLSLCLSVEMEEGQVHEIVNEISYFCGVPIRFLTQILRNDLGYKKPDNKVRYDVQVCTSLPCLSRGGGDILKACEKWLGLSCGSKTVDHCFSLSTRGCAHQCIQGPVVTINEECREDLTPTKMVFWLQDLAGEEKNSVLKATTVVRNPYASIETE